MKDNLRSQMVPLTLQKDYNKRASVLNQAILLRK